jgi:FBP C-terminal treble-clef zinc-finger
MQFLSEKDVRASFVNTSVRERNTLALPAAFDTTPWEQLDYLGWRDPKLPQIGYVVVRLDDAPVGVMLRQTDQRARSRPQCAWCEDVTLPNDVVFFSAKRAGQAGRNGNTVGTMVCAEFQCSSNVRKLPPLAYPGYDREAARERRITALGVNARAFVGGVLER